MIKTNKKIFHLPGQKQHIVEREWWSRAILPDTSQMAQTHLSVKIIGSRDMNLSLGMEKPVQKIHLRVYPMCCTKSSPDSITSQDQQPKLMLLFIKLYLMSLLHFSRKIDYYRMKKGDISVPVNSCSI